MQQSGLLQKRWNEQKADLEPTWNQLGTNLGLTWDNLETTMREHSAHGGPFHMIRFG